MGCKEQIELLKHYCHLDRPFLEQYALWAWGLLQGDLGYSFEYRLPVVDVVGDRLWLTILVSFATILFTWVVAFPDRRLFGDPSVQRLATMW